MKHVAAFASGGLFAIGLAVAGMTQPSKVVGFLDFFGDWDPSLAFVMGGAIAVYLPLHRLVTKRKAPLLEARFFLPTRRDIDGRLVVGSAIFGVGWGLAGFCPGPAITAVGASVDAAIVVTVSMFGGFVLFRLFDTLRSRPSQRERGTRDAAASHAPDA